MFIITPSVTLSFHLVTLRRIRSLATYELAILHIVRSLSPLMVSILGSFRCFRVSSSSFSRSLSPFHTTQCPSATSFSIPCSSLITCPNYLKGACVALGSSVHFGLMISSRHTLVCLSIQYALISRLQHHISNALIFFLSAFRIVPI